MAVVGLGFHFWAVFPCDHEDESGIQSVLGRSN